MFRIKKELCLGCGICTSACFRQAISLSSGYAEIDLRKCNGCGLCAEVCSQGAIFESKPVSREELHEMVSSLRSQTDSILRRIERLERSRR